MGKTSGVFRRFWNQNVWGDSPGAPCATVEEYKRAIGADSSWKPARWEAIRQNLERYHSDQGGETSLISWGVDRHGIVVTLFALLFVFGFDHTTITRGTTLIVISGVCLSLILLVWGLAPRLKIARKVTDLGLHASTEVTDDPATTCYALYVWLHHRVCMRTAIDRFFLMVCLIAGGTLGLIWVNVIIRAV